jgi:hypothetical protein
VKVALGEIRKLALQSMYLKRRFLPLGKDTRFGNASIPTQPSHQNRLPQCKGETKVSLSSTFLGTNCSHIESEGKVHKAKGDVHNAAGNRKDAARDLPKNDAER